jgi:hypothetical protein
MVAPCRHVVWAARTERCLVSGKTREFYGNATCIAQVGIEGCHFQFSVLR